MKAYLYEKQQGFTLIELMIALVLGLLISAAAVQIYIANVRTATFQKSGSELQDASVFGMQQLTANIRIANLGNPITSINDLTTNSGIVLTGYNLGIYDKNTNTDTYPKKGLLTHSTGDKVATGNQWTGLSNVNNIGSDQLTIQYTNVTGQDMMDCESAIVKPNDIAVERYFLRKSTENAKVIVLACDAGRLKIDKANPSKTTVESFGGSGQEKIMNVDQFKVLLGTQTPATAIKPSQMMFLPSHEYLTLPKPRPPITSIRLGLIVSGNTAVLGNEDKTTFRLFNETHVIKEANLNTRDKKIRNIYETTVLLRNARVI